jgi:hypothetical protein
VEIFLKFDSWEKILLIFLDLLTGSHEFQFEREHQVMSWLGIFPNLSQKLNGLPDGVLSERLFEIGDLHGSRNEDDQSL